MYNVSSLRPVACLIFILCSFISTGVHGDSLTVLQAPEFVSFQKGDWPVSGEKIPDLVALTMGFSIQEVRDTQISSVSSGSLFVLLSQEQFKRIERN